MSNTDTNLKITIKSARVNSGLTQDEASDALGIDKSTLVRWEKDSTNIPAEKIRRIIDLYGVSFEHLFFGKSAN